MLRFALGFGLGVICTIGVAGYWAWLAVRDYARG